MIKNPPPASRESTPYGQRRKTSSTSIF